MYNKYNIQREKGQIQGFNKKNRAEKVHKKCVSSFAGKKIVRQDTITSFIIIMSN